MLAARLAYSTRYDGSTTDEEADLVRAEQRTQNAEAGSRRRSRGPERDGGPRELEVLLDRSDVPRAGEEIRQRLGVLGRGGSASLQRVARLGAEHLRLERLRVEVLEQELRRRAEVGEGELVVGCRTGHREPRRAESQRARPERAGQKPSSVHATR